MRNLILQSLTLVLGLCGTATVCYAIDNPDAPEHVHEFKQRASEHHTNIHQHAKTTQHTIKAYADYEKFLEQELDDVYTNLLAKLGTEQQAKLKQSQDSWVKYRNVEFAFIAHNWTAANFGSSAALSRGAYRTSLIHDRVVQLLHYLKNY